MNLPPSSSLTVGDALLRYEQQQNTPAGKRSINNLKTVLRRYLPLLTNFQNNSNSEESSKEISVTTLLAEQFLASDPLAQFEMYIQKAVEQGTIKPAVVRTTYRPALVKFLAAIEVQLALEKQELNELQPIPKQSQRFLIDPSQCAPPIKPKITLAKTVRGNRSHKQDPYSLYPEQLPTQVQAEITELQHFWLDKEVPNRQDTRMRPISFQDNILRSILFFFGWLHHVKQWDIACLNLDLLLVNGAQDQAEELKLIKEFIAWGINSRGNSYGWAMMIAKAPLAIAKWKYAAQSKRSKYSDIEVIACIRTYMSTLSRNYENEPSSLEDNKDLKLMTFEQEEAIVEYLRSCCAPYQKNHCKRPQVGVNRSWQRYLIIALLSYCPLRQREIRELELGRTLFREEGYRVRLKPDDNKTGDEREFRLVDVLPASVIADLDHWLDNNRADFVNQVKTASESPESWLKFLNYEPETLAAKMQKISEQMESLADRKSSREYIRLERKLKDLQAIPEARLQIPERLQRQFVFLMLGGTIGKDTIGLPIGRENFRSLVTIAVFNASSILKETGHPLFEGIEPRRTNPHFFRNNGITHERRHGDPEKRAAFHKMIGNSVSEGDRTYNEMTASEKTLQAAGWWDTEPKQMEIPPDLQAMVQKLQRLSPQERQMLKKLL